MSSSASSPSTHKVVMTELRPVCVPMSTAMPAVFADCLTTFATVWRSTRPPVGVVNTRSMTSPS
jgi:hypothetical protein